MNSILFPTDFTSVSLNAFTYAMKYALATNNKLIVYHAYDNQRGYTSRVGKSRH